MALETVALPGGEEIARLGIGTWQMEEDPREACIEAIRGSIDLGANLVDTAEMYGSGAVEELVGEAIEGLREEVFLVTKVLPRNASRQGTVEACRASLERLGTDHVDLYLLHWSSRYPIEETMAAFQELVDEGLTRYVGVSNLSLAEFDAAQAALGDELSLVTDQVLYWLGARNPEVELMPGLAERGVPLMAYSPLGQGELPDPKQPAGKVLADVAENYDATPHQVALAWVLRDEDVFTIPKASQLAHVEQNVQALEITLSGLDLARLDEAFKPPERAELQFL